MRTVSVLNGAVGSAQKLLAYWV